MIETDNRLLTTLSSWLKDVAARYGTLMLALLILGLGILAILLVQPSPLTFTEGWSATRGIDEVQLGYSHRAAMDGENHIHLVWQKRVGRKQVAFYARLDRRGQFVGGAIRLSDPNVNAEKAALALTLGDDPLCFWIEKGHKDGSQRLMMMRPEAGEPSQILSTSSKIMRDLAVAQDKERRVFLVWSDNRLGLYDMYMTVLDGEGNLSVAERRITDTGQAFVFEPALAVGGGVVHLTYFSGEVVRQSLVHQSFDMAGMPFSAPQVLEQVQQMAASLGGEGASGSYPVLAVAESDGQLRFYESLGPIVRQRVLDREGQTVQPASPLLAGGRYYSQVNLAPGEDQRWLVWSQLSWDGGDRFQVYAAFMDTAGRVKEPTRLTFASTSALWPLMLMDGQGGRHVIWQQSVGPYAYQMMYINDLEPARISMWQRLGFSGVGGGWGLVLAVVESAVLGFITAVINVWRPAVAWVVTVLVLLVARRVGRVKPYANLIAWVALLAVLFVVVQPQTKTLGQMPIVVAGQAHWVMWAAASAMVLYVGWVWREAFRSILMWAGMAGIWVWVYYLLNLTLILREGFAI